MIAMDAFQAYRYYLALKLHFTTDSYDVIKHKGRVKASRDKFQKQELMYRRIAKEYGDADLVNFLVANFVAGDRWGGVFDSRSQETFQQWKKRMESLSYIFKKDMSHIMTEMNMYTFDESLLFHCQTHEHPYIIRAYMSKSISLETLVILNKLFKFCDKFDLEIDEKFVWPDISRLIRKYSPFVKIDKEKYHAILRGL